MQNVQGIKASVSGTLLFLGLTFSGCQTRTEKAIPKAEPARRAGLSGARSAVGIADDGQWLMPAKSYASTRFSELGEINARNVGTLKVAWTFSTGSTRGQEAAPLVVGGTMYVVTPFPNYLYALDLANSGGGEVGLQAAGRMRRLKESPAAIR